MDAVDPVIVFSHELLSAGDPQMARTKATGGISPTQLPRPLANPLARRRRTPARADGRGQPVDRRARAAPRAHAVDRGGPSGPATSPSPTGSRRGSPWSARARPRPAPELRPHRPPPARAGLRAAPPEPAQRAPCPRGDGRLARQGASDTAIVWRVNILRMALGRAVKTRRLAFNVATFVDLPETRRAPGPARPTRRSTPCSRPSRATPTSWPSPSPSGPACARARSSPCAGPTSTSPAAR